MNAKRVVVLVAVVLLAVGVTAVGVTLLPRPSAAIDAAYPVEPAAILAELKAANQRYVTSHRRLSTDTRHDADRRRELTQGQHPFAAIVCCSDSRVCPEFIFDQQPGALFDIRNAGNVVDDDVMASLEYAIEHLHVRFLLIMGHEQCGAVEAVSTAGDRPLHDHLHSLQDHMPEVREQGVILHGHATREQLIDLSKRNAAEQAHILLSESTPVREAVERGEVRLMYALYHLESGQVDFFDVE